MLPYSQFDECIDLLTSPVDHLSSYNPVHSPLLGAAERIAEFFIEPFSLELENEILNKSSKEQKADLIKRYVSRLMKSKNHEPVSDIQQDTEAKMTAVDNEEITPEITRIKDLFIMDIPNDQSHELRFQRGCSILYHMLFDELQKCCSIYDIPFADICISLGLPLNTIHVHFPSQEKSILSEQAIDPHKGACEKLKLALHENGFFNLPKVRNLTEQSHGELIKLICANDVPYRIAMFDFLSFVDYFLSEYASTRTEMYKKFAEIFCAGNRPVSVRTIQGNINDLRKSPTNRDSRYTASLHIEEVKNHYETLK